MKLAFTTAAPEYDDELVDGTRDKAEAKQNALLRKLLAFPSSAQPDASIVQFTLDTIMQFLYYLNMRTGCSNTFPQESAQEKHDD